MTSHPADPADTTHSASVATPPPPPAPAPATLTTRTVLEHGMWLHDPTSSSGSETVWVPLHALQELRDAHEDGWWARVDYASQEGALVHAVLAVRAPDRSSRLRGTPKLAAALGAGC